MKKKVLSEIKLNQLSENELERRQMKTLMGGSDCEGTQCMCGTRTPPDAGAREVYDQA